MIRIVSLLTCMLALSGCFRATGKIQSTTEYLKGPPVEKLFTEQVPGGESIVIEPEIVGTELRIAAMSRQRCQDLSKTRNSVTRVERRELPWVHWLMFAGGVGAAGGGGWLITQGMTWDDSVGGTVVGDPDIERKRDGSQLMLVAGLGLLGAGAGLLGSELADMLSARDEDFPEPEAVNVAVLRDYECNARPAGGLELTITGQGKTAKITLGADGKFAGPLLEEPFASLPSADPWVTLSCKGCIPTPIALPPELDAQLVIQRGSPDEMRSWLKGKAPGGPVEAVRKALDAVESSRLEAIIQNANNEIAAGDFARAKADYDAIHLWLRDNGRHPQSERARSERDAIRLSLARLALAEARREVASEQTFPADWMGEFDRLVSPSDEGAEYAALLKERKALADRILTSTLKKAKASLAKKRFEQAREELAPCWKLAVDTAVCDKLSARIDAEVEKAQEDREKKLKAYEKVRPVAITNVTMMWDAGGIVILVLFVRADEKLCNFTGEIKVTVVQVKSGRSSSPAEVGHFTVGADSFVRTSFGPHLLKRFKREDVYAAVSATSCPGCNATSGEQLLSAGRNQYEIRVDATDAVTGEVLRGRGQLSAE